MQAREQALLSQRECNFECARRVHVCRHDRDACVRPFRVTEVIRARQGDLQIQSSSLQIKAAAGLWTH